MSDQPSSFSDDDCCKKDPQNTPDEKINTHYNDDVPPPLPPDRHKLPTITSSLASEKSFNTTLASFTITAESSPSTTNNTDLTNNSLPNGDSASSVETIYQPVDNCSNTTVMIDKAYMQERLLAYWKVISSKITVKIGSLILAVLLITVTCAISLVLTAPRTSSTRQPDTTSTTNTSYTPSFDQQSSFTIGNASQSLSLKTSAMIGGNHEGKLFSGQVAYEVGGPLIGLTVWSGWTLSVPPQGFSLQAKHGSYISEVQGMVQGEANNIDVLSDNEFITEASVTYNSLYICMLSFRSSLGRQFGPYTCSLVCNFLPKTTEQVKMGRLMYINTRYDSSLRAISFTYID